MSLWVWMGDPARADVALVPPAFGRTDERWTLGGAHVDYVANYELINDNLCDFSHVAYVHVNSFGSGREGAVEQFANRPTIEPLARGIRVTRWSEDSPAPPFLAGVDVDGLLDLYMTYDYLVPGVLLMWTGLFPRGTARALQHAKPTITPLHSAFSSQGGHADRRAAHAHDRGPNLMRGVVRRLLEAEAATT